MKGAQTALRSFFRIASLAAFASAIPSALAGTYFFDKTLKGNGTGADAANAKAFDVLYISNTLLNGSDLDVTINIAASATPYSLATPLTTTAANVSGMKVRLVGLGARSEDVVLLNVYPSWNVPNDPVITAQGTSSSNPRGFVLIHQPAGP